jgi:cyanophycinase
MPSPELLPGSRGLIIPIGGGEDKVSDRTVLRRFVEACGGNEARVAVIPTASQDVNTPDRYLDVFRGLGVQHVSVLPYKSRDEAEDPALLGTLEEATGVFLTGGAQLRLSTILGGTPVATLLRRINARGVPIAGTSAGASFLSEHMIAYGREGSTPMAGQVTLAPGLGLTNRLIVDQHFSQRDRLGRLMAALAYNPFAIGVGLDEDTAIFMERNCRFQVVGNGGVTVVDVSALEYSNMAAVDEGQPVQLIGVKLHVLTHGASFDLDSRKATPG